MRLSFMTALAGLLAASLLAGCVGTKTSIPGYTEGTRCQKQGDYEAAITHYQEYLINDPDTPLREIVFYRIAKSHRSLGNNEQAQVYYRKTIDADPDGVWADFAEEELREVAASD